MRRIILIICLIIITVSCEKQELLRGEFSPGIALTFDDAAIDSWYKFLPVLQKYQAHATFFITMPYVYDSTQLVKIKALCNAGNEIGCHSMNHINMKDWLKTRNLIDYYKEEIAPWLEFFNKLGIETTSFAYPYGDSTPESDKMLCQYFKKIRKVGGISGEPGSYALYKKEPVVWGGFLDRANNPPLTWVKKLILNSKVVNGVMVFISHNIEDNLQNDWSTSPALLDSVLNYTSKQGLKFYRIQDLN